MKPAIDTNEWPLVVVEWPVTIDEAEVDVHFAEMSGLIGRRERFCVALDLSRANQPSAQLRKHTAERLETVAARATEVIVGVAYIVPSPIMRAVITAIHWLAPVPFPYRVASTRPEAFGWLRERLAAPS